MSLEPYILNVMYHNWIEAQDIENLEYRLSHKKFSDLTQTLTMILTELSANSEITTIGSISFNILSSSLIHFNYRDFALLKSSP